MVGLHDAIKIIGPLIFKREQIEGHGLATIDDFLRGEGGFGFILIESKLTIANLVCFIHDVSGSG